MPSRVQMSPVSRSRTTAPLTGVVPSTLVKRGAGQAAPARFPGSPFAAEMPLRMRIVAQRNIMQSAFLRDAASGAPLFGGIGGELVAGCGESNARGRMIVRPLARRASSTTGADGLPRVSRPPARCRESFPVAARHGAQPAQPAGPRAPSVAPRDARGSASPRAVAPSVAAPQAVAASSAVAPVAVPSTVVASPVVRRGSAYARTRP